MIDFTDEELNEEDKLILDRINEQNKATQTYEETELTVLPTNIPKKKAKRDLKTNFYFPSKLIIEAKIYCIKHRTNLTALMNELLEERIYGKKEERQKEGIAEKRNAGKKERRDNGKKE